MLFQKTETITLSVEKEKISEKAIVLNIPLFISQTSNAEQTFNYPVLFSGIPSLVLSNSEINLLDQFFKVSLQQLQKLR